MTAVYSVVDIETTGLHRTDRIVEVAVISADGSGRPVKVWETLVNPERRPGPTHVHGIEPTECAKAPSFRQIARDLHDRLTGSVLIGHNLQFDWWYLRAEFARCGVTFLREGAGECTAEWCRSLGVAPGLDAACAVHGLQQRSQHSARNDAACTWLLWTALRKRVAGAHQGSPLIAGHGRHRLPAPSATRPRTTSTDQHDAASPWDLFH